MNMKKYTLRDEYTPISRDELKAFADEINPQGESKRAKGADAEKARKTGKGFARAKIYNILDNGKFEGHIYDRTEEINISKEEEDDIRMMEHPGRFDGFNGASKQSINDAPSYIKPTMIKFNGNAKPLDEINPEIETIMTDECISNGKWNGQLLTTNKYNKLQEYINNNGLYMTPIYEERLKTITTKNGIIIEEKLFRPIKNKHTGKRIAPLNIESIEEGRFKDLTQRTIKFEGEEMKDYGFTNNPNTIITIRTLQTFTQKGEKRTLKEGKEYETYTRNHTEGCMEKTTATKLEEQERKLYRIDRHEIIQEDTNGIMKRENEQLKPAIKQILYPLTSLPALYYDDLRKCMDTIGREHIPYIHEKGIGCEHPDFIEALNYYKYDKELNKYIIAHGTPEEIIIDIRNRHPQTQPRILNNYQIEIINKYKHIYNPMRA